MNYNTHKPDVSDKHFIVYWCGLTSYSFSIDGLKLDQLVNIEQGTSEVGGPIVLQLNYASKDNPFKESVVRMLLFRDSDLGAIHDVKLIYGQQVMVMEDINLKRFTVHLILSSAKDHEGNHTVDLELEFQADKVAFIY